MAKTKRSTIPTHAKIQVLTESGYRCAVPTCRTILLVDLHHMIEVSDGGGNEPSNLLPLCPNCHALYHREKIPRSSIAAWKSLIVSLNASLSISALDDLLFIAHQRPALELSADGVAKFSHLIGSGYADWSGTESRIMQFKPFDINTSKNVLVRMKTLAEQASGVVFVPAKYNIKLSAKGQQLVDALVAGDLTKVSEDTDSEK